MTPGWLQLGLRSHLLNLMKEGHKLRLLLCAIIKYICTCIKSLMVIDLIWACLISLAGCSWLVLWRRYSIFCLSFFSFAFFRSPIKACEPGAMSGGGQFPCHLPLTLPLPPPPPSPPLPSLPPPPPPCLLVGTLGSLHLGIWCANQHIADFFLGNILWWWGGNFLRLSSRRDMGTQ